MFLVLQPGQYNSNNIMFSEKTKNNILNNGDFYRLYYSAQNFTTNGLFILLSLKHVKVESYFSKVKCCFDKGVNSQLIKFVKYLESEILNMVPISSKLKPIHRVDEQLSQGFIKIFSQEEHHKYSSDRIQVLLKISGIWADESTYGLTFRFFFNRP